MSPADRPPYRVEIKRWPMCQRWHWRGFHDDEVVLRQHGGLLHFNTWSDARDEALTWLAEQYREAS